MWVTVFVNIPLPQSFTYSVPEEFKNDVVVGKRVQVLFRNRKSIAFVTEVLDTLPPELPFDKNLIKPIQKVTDTEILFTKEQIELSLWMEKFYLCSRGEALSAMLPSGKRETDFGGFSFEEDSVEFAPRNLSEEQKAAIDSIIHNKNTNNQFHYLYGSTGSGKTEVFLQVAESLLAEGKGVIYLVPEIGLTHQVIEAVIRRFGQTTAVLHSGLTGSQKLTEWHRILKREARIVIGARSGVFAPVPDLGLIIIDEEHDASYKAGNSPRYSARQVAMKRCQNLHIPLLMGSATPSVEAWKMMKDGLINKQVLTQRLAGGTTPDIEIVNLANEKNRAEGTGCISHRLEEEIRETHDRGRQTILFLNRRGFTHFFRCNSCGHELLCKNCSVALTYHRSENRLRCHYCGWSIQPPKECPECGSLDTGYAGFGTEFIENEVKAKFLGYKIERIDSDVVTNKNELQDRLEAFKKGEIDILLGTQMVAKGLNFPNLQLVGVVLADTGLSMPDFRASERTFSLLVQVAGRAGRFFPDGKVIIQTFNPYRSAISFASKNDIEGFYSQELEERKMLAFPPYSRLIRLVFRAANKEISENAASGASDILKSLSHNNTDFIVLGPSECPIAMISANYRNQILLRGTSLLPLQRAVHTLLYNYKSPAGIYIEVDVDPVSLL